jgi:Rad3-related DNA helicase
MACGFKEAIDLVGDKGRWQIIAHLGLPNLGDEVIAMRREANPSWYAWQGIKNIVQSSGRVCRGPEDYGVTYIPTKEILWLLEEHRDLFPGVAFLDAIEYT